MTDNAKMCEEVLRISGVDPRKCMKCGKCTAACPSYDEMEYHPHEFVAMVDSGEIELLLDSDAVYKCLSCMACVERCPRGVKPGRLIEAVRLMAVRRKDCDRLTPDKIINGEAVPADMPGQALVTAFRKYRK